MKKETGILELLDQGKCGSALELLLSLIDDRCYELFHEWLQASSEEERQLRTRAIEFQEEYFSDVTLQDDSTTLTKAEDVNTGAIYEHDLSETFNLCISEWRFKIIGNTNKYGAVCHQPENLIEVTEKHKDDDLTLLHEMIHAYEWMLSRENEMHKQFIILSLYKKLVKEIPNLLELITTDIHEILKQHSVFFTLKSLDLDLRLGKPLGSVYSYGREVFFANKHLPK